MKSSAAALTAAACRESATAATAAALPPAPDAAASVTPSMLGVIWRSSRAAVSRRLPCRGCIRCSRAAYAAPAAPPALRQRKHCAPEHSLRCQRPADLCILTAAAELSTSAETLCCNVISCHAGMSDRRQHPGDDFRCMRRLPGRVRPPLSLLPACLRSWAPSSRQPGFRSGTLPSRVCCAGQSLPGGQRGWSAPA